MSRPLTKGRTIGFHLPLALDGILRQFASDRRLSPGLLAAEVISGWLTSSGAPSVSVEVTLSPGAVAALDALAANSGVTVSQAVERLIRPAPTAAATKARHQATRNAAINRREGVIPPPAAVTDILDNSNVSTCQHEHIQSLPSGLKKCRDCGKIGAKLGG